MSTAATSADLKINLKLHVAFYADSLKLNLKVLFPLSLWLPTY